MLHYKPCVRLFGHLPILTSRILAHPAKIPNVTTSPSEDAIGQAILSIIETNIRNHDETINELFLPGSIFNIRLTMIRIHMNAPNTKLEPEADTIELAITNKLSPMVTV